MLIVQRPEMNRYCDERDNQNRIQKKKKERKCSSSEAKRRREKNAVGLTTAMATSSHKLHMKREKEKKKSEKNVEKKSKREIIEMNIEFSILIILSFIWFFFLQFFCRRNFCSFILLVWQNHRCRFHYLFVRSGLSRSFYCKTSNVTCINNGRDVNIPWNGWVERAIVLKRTTNQRKKIIQKTRRETALHPAHALTLQSQLPTTEQEQKS